MPTSGSLNHLAGALKAHPDAVDDAWPPPRQLHPRSSCHGVDKVTARLAVRYWRPIGDLAALGCLGLSKVTTHDGPAEWKHLSTGWGSSAPTAVMISGLRGPEGTPEPRSQAATAKIVKSLRARVFPHTLWLLDSCPTWEKARPGDPVNSIHPSAHEPCSEKSPRHFRKGVT